LFFRCWLVATFSDVTAFMFTPSKVRYIERRFPQKSGATSSDCLTDTSQDRRWLMSWSLFRCLECAYQV
jgi:hypothetical protein